MTRLRHRPAPDVRVEIRGELPREDAEYARTQAVELISALGPDAHTARVRVTRLRHRALTRPVVVQGSVELDGVGRVRVQLAAASAREAVDVALGTLAGRAARLREQGHIGLAVAYQSAYCPQYAPRPLAERQIVRYKTVVPALRTPDQAVRELLALDHTFHLFVDALTGQDSVVHRAPVDGGLRLVRAHSAARFGSGGLPLTESPYPAPRLDPAEAARRLWLTCWPFVFHTDPDDGRGRVLYRRYDGHYGLLRPEGPEGPQGRDVPQAPPGPEA
ncbi:sigma 54 modulation/S30EA ribosomal C-terminal domain-containing protein [Kitasatospora sp. A2-31]|uniref:sigma 54 modulation/S30EA ribosomal C-terminal domain-containing protein n=1 Tax=Kitasatospora sp. A2-31 TaxID=2916414 RepID=UPI001EECF1EC|nr:sigma 54 modulation/S30EA ribosomal C-terminal domain-containing protein [Kitasatospora sp. A2-31]MCG6497899.1 sigma 54 modulation/S30EA ribosomal C-terminal domain-containing protein [Kitasatospora sp. A2-31]